MKLCLLSPTFTTPTPLPTPPISREAPTVTTIVLDPLPAVLQRFSNLESKFKAWTKVDHFEAIDASVQANLIYDVKNQLPNRNVNLDKVLMKRDCGDDQDPTAGSDQGKKKKRNGKDSEPSKDKVQTGSSSKGKT
ncbi:hypothetical protein Tco_0039315 [Tanacetum coccineum]